MISKLGWTLGVGMLLVLAALLGGAADPGIGRASTTGSVIALDFDDGQLPSAHGWVFQGQDNGWNPIDETVAASVADGILTVDTATPFGVYSGDAMAYWTFPLGAVDPDNFVMEIRMRAIEPGSWRMYCYGLLGMVFGTRGSYDASLSVMTPQVTFHNITGQTCDTELYLDISGSIFHTYKIEVRNGVDMTGYVDDQLVAAGVLQRSLPPPAVSFGDGSTSGGNVTAEVDWLRVASLMPPDTTPPVVVPPADLTLDATSPDGAVATFAASATDDVDGPLTPTCEPASGSTFAIHTTTVTCSATDSAGNTGSAAFTVTVKGAPEQLDDLLVAVQGLGPGSSLSDKVTAIGAAVASGQTAIACDGLHAFVNQVRAQTGKKISPAQASALIGAAQRIESVLGCGR